MVAPEVTEGFGGLQSAISGIAAALKTQYDAMTLVEAALPGMEQFTKSLIKTSRPRPLSWGSWRPPQLPPPTPPQLPRGHRPHRCRCPLRPRRRQGVPGTSGGEEQQEKGPGAGGDSGGSKTINIHMGGSVLMTEAERGDSVRRMLDEAERHGILRVMAGSSSHLSTRPSTTP